MILLFFFFTYILASEVKFENAFDLGGERGYSHPDVSLLDEESSTAISVTFRSHSSRIVNLYWNDNRKGLFSGLIRPDNEATMTAYEGHEFWLSYAKVKNPRKLVTFKIVPNKRIYVYYDRAHPGNAEQRVKTESELTFLQSYFNRTGLVWNSFYGPDGPRGSPVLFMRSADYLGQKHSVVSQNGMWFCNDTSRGNLCQSREPVELTLEVFSLKPRAFVIKNLFSHFEADSIITCASPKLKESTVGDTDGGGIQKSSTRTSKTTWVDRSVSDISETLYRRAADVLGLDHEMLRSDRNAESMQVVHYDVGQKYDAHHDWGSDGYVEDRFITLLLYLTDKESAEAGGETSFPKAKPHGIKVHPGKGSAVLFYNLLEDGNADDLSLHSALPIKRGTKWLANFWVWDPRRR